MAKQPLVEVFGFPLDNFSAEAELHRKNRLCPFNNKVPACTKDKANDPLGVCSIVEGDNLTITCPVRFRQDWRIAENAFDDSLKNADFNQIINVASVPHYSPFRYPGGKTWLVPRIRQWLANLPAKPAEFIEPFGGGGIVSLTVAFENLARHVTMVELDEQVAVVWQTIFEGNAAWLAERIATFEFTVNTVNSIMLNTATSQREKAFQTILKNRVNRGGILAAGAGKVKNGENGKGIKSRWYPETLKRRILNLITLQDCLSFVQADGIEVLKQKAEREDTIFFIDPPYTAAGKKAGNRLYNCSELDHEELFRIASILKGQFLMTYDNTEEICQLAEKYDFEVQPVAMKSTHHAKMTELLIGRNLDWVKK